ncbi:unnamed protein product [Eruca vesicaria subsp. sativa]|uniref:Dehydrogenase E1 component domain-containing protein n=1 Tax=Eruca vesicaria subsp. sativa TaxID=29727 RepID=A0ABC8JBF9_ERUVS|nr:unnamed protein product [Eruca vesicaria subsp. sativa]
MGWGRLRGSLQLILSVETVPGLKVDGMDVLAVKQACKFAKEHTLKNGPIVRDPIERVRKLLLSHDIPTEKELKDMEKEVRKEVDDAVAQAKESPVPEASELFTNMYVKDCGVETEKNSK